MKITFHYPLIVIPANAEIQLSHLESDLKLDPRLRGGDGLIEIRNSKAEDLPC